MKATRLFAAAAVLVSLAAAPGNAATAATIHVGTRAVPGTDLVGGGRFAAVVKYQPAGKISKVSANWCSIGVPWRLANGTRGFLTAGHCLPANDRTGAQIIRSSQRPPYPWLPGAALGARPSSMTTFRSGQGTIPGKVGDLAFVATKQRIWNQVFNGGSTATTRYRILSWTSKATSGYRLCFSGSYTGSRCDLRLGAANTSYQYGKVKITGLAEAYYPRGSSSQRCPLEGDSGGVVYRMLSGTPTVAVVGIISGGAKYVESGTGKVRWDLGCKMYYTPLGAAQKQFGGGPIIS